MSLESCNLLGTPATDGLQFSFSMEFRAASSSHLKLVALKVPKTLIIIFPDS